MRVPSMGCKGAANYLTDSMESPGFYRLGTVSFYAKGIPVQLAKPYEWKEIKFVCYEASQRDWKKCTEFFNQHGIKLAVIPLTGDSDEAVKISKYLNSKQASHCLLHWR